MFLKKSSRVSAKKALIIGLDCCDPVLTFEKFYDQLPTIKFLTEQGVFGVMQSTIPPITIPAWTAMASSKDPGTIGVYGFRNRADYSYDKLIFATNLAVKVPRIWDILGQSGKKSFVFGVPQTYPPSKINGWMISSFLTPSIDSNFTYPPELRNEVLELTNNEYIIDVKGYRTEKKDWLLSEIYRMAEQRFELTRHFIKKYDWDLFWMVDMGVDRIHHGFWQYMDPKHHRYQPGNKFETAILDYYKYIDNQIASLLEFIDLETTAIWIVSDHGAKCMVGGVCFNDWLIRKGYLTLKNMPSEPTRFADVEIDWSKTLAWGEGGYYGRCFINLKGREPDGQLPESEYERFCNKLIDELESMKDHQGKPMGTKVYRPKDIYKTVNGTPPDLIVLFGGLDWRSVGTVGNPDIYTFENDTGPDDANHNIDGMFIAAGAGIGNQHSRKKISIYDFAPSLLTQLGYPVPNDMIGKSIINS